MDDAGLIALSKAGNPHAFATLVQRHERDVRSFVASRIGVLGPVDEIATEAFTRAWLGLARFEKDDSFGPWIKGIARLVLMERARENGRTRSEAPVLTQATGDGALHKVHDERLLKAVDELPDVLREIVALRFFAGLSCAQAAQRLGVPIGTVTKRLSRAYAELRRSLGVDAPQSNSPNPPAKQEITR